MKIETDFLVIGSGMAGLTFALKAATVSKVTLITKVTLEETNTRYAQGGIASVTYSPDSIEKHVRDTIVAGQGYCDEEVVRMVAEEAPERIKELISWGIPFDKKQDGKFDLAREGGHTEQRILHHKDNTGEVLQKVLSEKVRSEPNITVLENHFAIDLITQHHFNQLIKKGHEGIDCYGAYVLDSTSGKVKTISSKVTVIATGGIGNLYLTTTNPVVATGDGVAMVYRAKGLINNMEFIQFHPTALYNPGESPSFLITEALRGFGGILINSSGERFMNKYDPRGSLAPRDIVARAIDSEMKIRGEDNVYLDCRHLDKKELKKNFPNIWKKCRSIGVNISHDPIPVVPAAHYLCGGISVDMDGQSSINRLYAIGESSSTGLHGANRLASNSLIEAVVFSHRAYEHSKPRLKSLFFKEGIPEWDIKGTRYPEEMVLVTQNYKEMQMIMSNYVGIVRSDLRLERALRRLEIIYSETEALYRKSSVSRIILELRNLINVAYLVIKMAMERKESLGLHYTIDYPEKQDKKRK